MQKENINSKRHKEQFHKVTCRLGQSVKRKKYLQKKLVTRLLTYYWVIYLFVLILTGRQTGLFCNNYNFFLTHQNKISFGSYLLVQFYLHSVFPEDKGSVCGWMTMNTYHRLPEDHQRPDSWGWILSSLAAVNDCIFLWNERRQKPVVHTFLLLTQMKAMSVLFKLLTANFNEYIITKVPRNKIRC